MITAALVWVALSPVVGLLIGRAIRIADNGTTEPDLLADQPVEVLAPAEIRRRIAAFEEDMAA